MQQQSDWNGQYPWPPRVQVAGVSTVQEALFCKEVGVDCLGFTLGLPGGIHDGLTEQKAASIISRLPQEVLPLVITYVQSGHEACRLVTAVGAAAIQFHGGITDEEIRLFREVCPAVRTIGLVSVTGTESIRRAAEFTAPSWDCIILDSVDSTTGQTGATGLVHDWGISAAIVRMARVPVILAGGLTPENVAQAITLVQPDGVDAHTGLEDTDGTRNLTKIRTFTRKALDAFRAIKKEASGRDRLGRAS